MGMSTPGSLRSLSSARPRGSVRTAGTPGSVAASSALRGLSTGMTSETNQETVIWGTTLNVTHAMSTFRGFLRFFKAPSGGAGDNGAAAAAREAALQARVQAMRAEGGGGATESQLEEAVAGRPVADGHYMSVLREMRLTEAYHLNVNCADLAHFNEDCAALYEQLVKYPTDVIVIMDLVANEQLNLLLGPDGGDTPAVEVRLHNLREVKLMRDLDPVDIDTLVAITGMVIRTSAVIPDLRSGYFLCSNCEWEETVQVDKGRIEEPTVCRNCQAKNSFRMVHNRCVFKDKQLIKLQETPESIPEGETPHTVVLYAHEHLVDTVVPGDRVQVTGVFRALGHRTNPRMRTLRSVYKSYVDVVHFAKSSKGRVAAEDETVQSGEYAALVSEGAITEEEYAAREARVRAMAATPELYNKLARSLAPSIWELDDVKKGVLLQLFGGSTKDLGRQGRFRGELNVLLCGDPGVSKSQLLSYVHKIAPRGIYTSGKGSSAVGLTAYVTKDPETKAPVLESGALVLSDRGVCCIDEFDKMSDSTRSILHEVMEQQTVSIAKAGIICTLNARTSILAAANPVESRYNPKLSVVENIQLPPTLLSRFDLIYLMLDKVDKAADATLAAHLVALYYKPEHRAAQSSPFTLQQMTEFVSWARSHVNPTISGPASRRLVEGYLAMRRLGAQGGGKKVITATPRQLESLIRLSEAHAKLHLRSEVLAEDVEEALRLINTATQKAATDPVTGQIDMDAIATGHTASARVAVTQLKEAVMDSVLGLGSGAKLSFNELVKRLAQGTDMAIDEGDLKAAVGELAKEGTIRYNSRTRVLTV